MSFSFWRSRRGCRIFTQEILPSYTGTFEGCVHLAEFERFSDVIIHCYVLGQHIGYRWVSLLPCRLWPGFGHCWISNVVNCDDEYPEGGNTLDGPRVDHPKSVGTESEQSLRRRLCFCLYHCRGIFLKGVHLFRIWYHDRFVDLDFTVTLSRSKNRCCGTLQPDVWQTTWSATGCLVSRRNMGPYNSLLDPRSRSSSDSSWSQWSFEKPWIWMSGSSRVLLHIQVSIQ